MKNISLIFSLVTVLCHLNNSGACENKDSYKNNPWLSDIPSLEEMGDTPPYCGVFTIHPRIIAENLEKSGVRSNVTRYRYFRDFDEDDNNNDYVLINSLTLDKFV